MAVLIQFLLAFLLIIQLSAQPGPARGLQLTLTNPSAYALTDKPISLPRNRLEGNATGLFPRLTDKTGRLVPAQLDDTDGDGRWDHLFLVMNLPPHATRTLLLRWVVAPPSFPNRARVRFGKRSGATEPVKPRTSDTFYPDDLPIRRGYQPYQTDGPTWENDKVAYRHYFDGRNAKDLFGKRITAMSPDSVGLTPTGAVEDNYHVLRNWGRDVLPVGNSEGLSVGIGGIGLLIDGRLHRVGVTATDSVHTIDSTTLRVLASGPVKASLKLQYHHWKPTASRDYCLIETPAIWPGMYAYQNTVQVTGLAGDEELVIGLPNVATDKPVTVFKQDGWVVLYTHDQQSYNREYWLGLAIIVPEEYYLGHGEAPPAGAFAMSYYARLRTVPNRPVSYYALGGWELSDARFRDPAYFEAHIRQFVQQCSTDVSITYTSIR